LSTRAGAAYAALWIAVGMTLARTLGLAARTNQTRRVATVAPVAV
jgi:hypothetical protein